MASISPRPGLLFVLLDDLRRTHPRLIRIITEFAQRPPLAQQIPVLIQLHLEALQAIGLGPAQRFLRVERLLFVDEGADMVEDARVAVFDRLHATILSPNLRR